MFTNLNNVAIHPTTANVPAKKTRDTLKLTIVLDLRKILQALANYARKFLNLSIYSEATKIIEISQNRENQNKRLENIFQ